MAIIGKDLIVTRTHLAEARLVDATFPEIPPEGQCLLRIASFALTANNITYGVAADMLGYWDFFPTESDKDGRIPVWGFADVIASSHPGVAVGERVYGYLPMSTHVMVQPERLGKSGFFDAAPHRAERSPIYNQYTLTRTDPMWHPEREATISLFRPLFTTAFLLEDMHREAAYFGAGAVILSSASSKTSVSLAHLLSQNKPDAVQVVGLTSTGNRSFVEKLGCYDAVVTYDALNRLPKGTAAFVDMAGNADLRRRVHETLQDRLRNSCAVGMTHWQASAGLSGDLPGPRPTFFFAPAYGQKRLADWGAAGYQARLAKAWSGFTDQADAWFDVKNHTGPDAALSQYQKMLAGDISPRAGLILSMQPT